MKIYELKQNKKIINQLTEGHPRAFRELLKYGRGLDFQEEPDYATILDIFKEALRRLEEEKKLAEEAELLLATDDDIMSSQAQHSEFS